MMLNLILASHPIHPNWHRVLRDLATLDVTEEAVKRRTNSTRYVRIISMCGVLFILRGGNIQTINDKFPMSLIILGS